MSGVYSEEQAIFRAQQLELIYSQSGILQKYLPDAPRSKVDIAKSKPGPHGDGIVGSVDMNAVNLLSQLQQLSLQTTSNNQVTSSTTSSSQPSSINVINMITPKEIKTPMGKRKDEVRKRIRMGRLTQINPKIMLLGVEMSLKRKSSFHASCVVETI